VPAQQHGGGELPHCELVVHRSGGTPPVQLPSPSHMPVMHTPFEQHMFPAGAG
jgi:hypothetical protein